MAQKCTGCAHLLDDGWTDTRCSQVCPADAIKLVLADDAEMAARVAAEGLEVLRPELGAKPRVYYKNLHLFDKAFIAGNVVFGDTDECAEGAKVTVTAGAGGAVAGEAVASNYGDFYVDKLEPGRGVHRDGGGAGLRAGDPHGEAGQEPQPGDDRPGQEVGRPSRLLGGPGPSSGPARCYRPRCREDQIQHAQVRRPRERAVAQVGQAVDVLGQEPADELVGEQERVHVRADAALGDALVHQRLEALLHAEVVRDHVRVERAGHPGSW